MLYRLEFKKANGSLLYALETTDYYMAEDHWVGADRNPEIVEVVWKVDRYDGKGMQEVKRYSIERN